MTSDHELRTGLRAEAQSFDPDVDAAWNRFVGRQRRHLPRRRGILSIAALAFLLAAIGGLLLVRTDDSQEVQTGMRGGASDQTSPTTNVGDGDHEVASNSDAAVDACERFAVADYPGELRAAYRSTVRSVIELLPDAGSGRAVPEYLQARADEEPMTACYIDGEFAAPAPPGHPGYKRALVLVGDDGDVWLMMVGPRGAPDVPDMEIIPPPDAG